MSKYPDNFIDLVLEGEALPEEIDDFVDKWHEGEGEVPLAHFLGLSQEEYSFWVLYPQAIPLIVAARAKGQPLADAANDNVTSLKMAARSEDTQVIKQLKRWIEQHRDG